MAFINPLDILGISPRDPAPDSSALRKARRAKLLEFDLADEGLIYYEDLPVTRADFSRACEEIEHPETLAVYRALQRLPAFQRFLLHGEILFFGEPPPKWVYHPKFLDVVGPYFAEQYASALTEAVQNGDRENVRYLVARPPLASEDLYPRLYREAGRIVADQAERLEELTTRIEKGNVSKAFSANAATDIVDIRLLEALPPYFEGARSKVAQAARLLAVTVFNELDDVDAAAAILIAFSKLSVNGITANQIREDLKQVESIRDQRQLTKQYAPTLEAVAAAFVRLRALIEAAESSHFDTRGVVREVIGLVDVGKLNALPGTLSELRDHIAMTIRGLALICWNEHTAADIAVALTKFALLINVEGNIRQQLQEAFKTLSQLDREVSSKAEEEGRMLLGLLENMAQQTREGFFGSNVNWSKVEEILTTLFDAGGVRLLSALKDQALKTEIRSVLFIILDRLRGHRSVGASRIRALVEPVLSTSPASSGDPGSRTTSTKQSVPPTQRDPRPPVPPVNRSPASAPNGRPSEPSGGTSSAKSSNESAWGILFLTGVVVVTLIAMAIDADDGVSRRSTEPDLPPAPFALGPTMEIEVVAARGKLSPVRVKVDGDVRRPHWVEMGDRVDFSVKDSLFIEEELEEIVVLVNGNVYPGDYRDAAGRLVITRASATAALNGRPLPAIQLPTRAAPRPAVASRPPQAQTKSWRGNQLVTGSSPYSAYFGNGVYSSSDDNEIVFRNGPGVDVVICLVEVAGRGRVIRNEYIRAGESFTMTQLPNGVYFIRGFYGEDWNPDLELLGGRIIGGFESNASYSESRQDPLSLRDDGYSATAYEVTLYSVSNGNMESAGINASSFFN